MKKGRFLYIKLRSFDSRLLDKSIASIILTVKRAGSKIKGPVFLPRRIMKFTVNRSPHIDKKSREQFEIRYHKRLLMIPEAGSIVVQALTNLQLPAGIDVEVKVVGDGVAEI